MNSIIILLEEIFNYTNHYPHQNKINMRFSQTLALASTKLNFFKMAQTKYKNLLHRTDLQAKTSLSIDISSIFQIILKIYELSRKRNCMNLSEQGIYLPSLNKSTEFYFLVWYWVIILYKSYKVDVFSFFSIFMKYKIKYSW